MRFQLLQVGVVDHSSPVFFMARESPREPSWEMPPQRRPSQVETALRDGVSRLFSRRKSSASDAPLPSSKMKNLDLGFFGQEDDEDEDDAAGSSRGGLGKREGTGLLDDEPDRAETDFYNGDSNFANALEPIAGVHACFLPR
jgi:hypothetical protein